MNLRSITVIAAAVLGGVVAGCGDSDPVVNVPAADSAVDQIDASTAVTQTPQGWTVCNTEGTYDNCIGPITDADLHADFRLDPAGDHGVLLGIVGREYADITADIDTLAVTQVDGFNVWVVRATTPPDIDSVTLTVDRTGTDDSIIDVHMTSAALTTGG